MTELQVVDKILKILDEKDEVVEASTLKKELNSLRVSIENRLSKARSSKIANKRKSSAYSFYYKTSSNYVPDYFKLPLENFDINGVKHTVFMDSCSYVCSREEDIWDGSYAGKAPNSISVLLSGLLPKHGSIKINMRELLDYAKGKGYKLLKRECGEDASNTVYFLQYKGLYFRLGVLDKAFSIINLSDSIELFSEGKCLKGISELGYLMILPVIFKGRSQMKGIVVIDLEDFII